MRREIDEAMAELENIDHELASTIVRVSGMSDCNVGDAAYLQNLKIGKKILPLSSLQEDICLVESMI